MWGIAAFNEDPDYVIILDRYPGIIHLQFHYYFFFHSYFRRTSIVLYSNMTSNCLSIVCHSCIPPQQIWDQNDTSILRKKLFPIKDLTLSDFSAYEKYEPTSHKILPWSKSQVFYDSLQFEALLVVHTSHNLPRFRTHVQTKLYN